MAGAVCTEVHRSPVPECKYALLHTTTTVGTTNIASMYALCISTFISCGLQSLDGGKGNNNPEI